MASTRRGPQLSVVIPTLDEAGCIGTTVQSVRALPGPPEVLVVDGGSSDGTVACALAAGATVLRAASGRGAQLHAGAMAAGGDVLWFLHADTVPPPDAVACIAAALRDRRVVAGNFALRFDGSSRAAALLTAIYGGLGCIGLRYGDSGYFVRREVYHAVGGFRPLPIFEDLDLLRRLRRSGRFVRVPAVLVTSSRRFEGRSFAAVFAHWTWLQLLYWLGVSPHRLGRSYADVRAVDRAPQERR